MFVYHMQTVTVEAREREMNPLELELQMTVSHHMGTRN